MSKYAYFKPIDYSYFKEMHDTDKYNEYIISLHEINLLNDRISKAIEYIRKREDNFFVPHFTGKETNELLDILKGE